MEENNKIWWDEKEGIGRYWISGEITEEMARNINEMYIKLAEEHDVINGLIDLRELSRVPASRTRKMLAGIIMKHPKVGKMAMITSKIAIKTAAKFILAACGKASDAKFFSSEEEALKWLKKGE